jgi:hypothetical protein
VKEFANTAAVVSSTGCAIVEWRRLCTPIVIPAAEPQSFLSGIRECPGWLIVPDNKRFVRQWSHISNPASVVVVSRKGRLRAVHIAAMLCPLKPRLPILKPMLPALGKAGNGREIGVPCTA